MAPRTAPLVAVPIALGLLACASTARTPLQNAELDAESTRRVREHTTDPRYLTEWVDHVPEHETIPSPRDFLGHVVGTPGRLTRPETIVAYFRELERTSPRLRVFSMGRSHGGREMIVAAVGAEDLLARMDEITEANRRLADPRGTDREAARELARRVPPTYWITAGLHSPETGPPEMVMELAYRLVVSEREPVPEIRDGVLTLISPVLEMDGRARTVDWHERYLKDVTDRDDAPPFSAPYWGDYTFHDNNRDGLQASQPLTRNYNATFHRFLPVVSLDLHESVPLLYVSTGTGPYNETISPITVTEWQWMASWDVSQATRLGLEGVWSWGFYTGWYPGYLLWVTNNHNAVGRFYETYGNSLSGTFERDLSRSTFADDRADTRQWYRAAPPATRVLWSLRNNTNYMQTGALASLLLAARSGEELLLNRWQKGFDAVERGRREPPHAFHVPRNQADAGALHQLLALLAEHRIEVEEVTGAASAGELELAPGDFLVRTDQPYGNFARTLLSRQAFPEKADHPPYDDVSWSLPLMLGVDVAEVADPVVLDVDVRRLDEVPTFPGRVEDAQRWIVDHVGQATLAGFVWAAAELEGVRLRALGEPSGEHPAGSLVVDGVAKDELAPLAARFHLDLAAASDLDAPLLDVDLPRVALYHTWTYTQDSGWARYTLEQLGVPYTLIAKDDVRAGGLRDRFDVVLVPSTGRLQLKHIVGGIDEKWGPMPYTTTPEFPSHGIIDSSPDITGGLGFEGLAELQRFVRSGGLLVTLGGACRLAVDSGIARGVDSLPPGGTPGSHVSAKVLRPEHPVAFGFGDSTHVFHGNLPGLRVPDRDLGRTLVQYGHGTLAEAERKAAKKAGAPAEPRSEPAEAEDGEDGEDEPGASKRPPLCLSGLVEDPSVLERRPALLDVPVGDGHVLLFSWNPLHRYQNRHEFAFVGNALLFHDDLPGTPTEAAMRAREDG